MRKTIDWWFVLDLFCWGIDTLGRPSISRALRGYDDDRYRTVPKSFWQRLASEEWVTRHGRGAKARFTITAKGRQQCAEPDPRASWNDPWDQKWRVVTFDVPERRAKDRVALWREFRARKLGFLQRSVWVWPRPIDAILQEVIQASGVPECFAGFESTRLILCTDEEVVRTAWDFEEIGRAHQSYLKRAGSYVDAIQNAANVTALARAARQERLAYEKALREDPLLPRVLWPSGYAGHRVRDHHEATRAELARRLPQVLVDESM